MLGKLALATGGKNALWSQEVEWKAKGEPQGRGGALWFSQRVFPLPKSCAAPEVGTSSWAEREEKIKSSFQFSLLSFKYEEDAVGPGDMAQQIKGLLLKC